uniref:Uncharacterized protein n=1 Tax=Strigamia maritima TaxID=126957 RepID=T1IQK0_STRMM
MKGKTIAFLAIYCVLIFIIGNAWTKCLHCEKDDQTKCCKGESNAEACDDEGHCRHKLTDE